MKLKYYLRGVGTGILFATIILLISYAYKLSDGQIKKKALELGMVYPTQEQSSSDVADNNGQSTTSGTGNNEDESGETSSTKEPTSENDTTKEPESDEPTTEEPTTEEPTTEKPTTEKPTSGNDSNVSCVITVTNHTASHHVAIQLADAGIIENAEEFNNYLIDNGYAYRIQNGTFTFTKGMTYKEMADYLATGRR